MSAPPFAPSPESIAAPLDDACFRVADGLMTVDAAVAHLIRTLTPVTGVQTLPLADALDRVLAHDIQAPHALPPFDQSAMDGYALCAADAAAAPAGDLLLALDGRTAAGDATLPLRPGAARRIFTGAPLPPGADVVIPQEDVRTPDAGHVLIPEQRRRDLKPGRHCRAAGEDVAVGATVMMAGRRLDPVALGLAGALGLAELPVRAPLRVVVLSTGNEVRPAGAALVPGAIHDANGPLLTALLRRLGAVVVSHAIIPDQPALIEAALRDAATRADLIVTSGGASVGEEDHLRAVVDRLGRMDFWRLAIKPGKPVGLGVAAGCPVLALPGNPMAAVAAFLMVGRTLVQCLSGATPTQPVRLRVPAAFSFTHTPGKRAYLRARLVDGAVDLCTPQGSAALSSLLLADGLVELPDEGQTVVPGSPVTLLPLAGWM